MNVQKHGTYDAPHVLANYGCFVQPCLSYFLPQLTSVIMVLSKKIKSCNLNPSVLQNAPEFNAGTQGFMGTELVVPVVLYNCMVSDIMERLWVKDVQAQGAEEDI